MPIAHTIDTERRVVRSRLWGIVTEADAWESVAALRNDPAFDPTYNQLADLREMREARVGKHSVRELAVLPIFAPESRRALVVASDLQYGISRMTTSHAEAGDQQIAIFRTVAEAETWLGIDRE